MTLRDKDYDQFRFVQMSTHITQKYELTLQLSFIKLYEILIGLYLYYLVLIPTTKILNIIAFYIFRIFFKIFLVSNPK